ncbi:hypothetical protein B0H14DRAFT_3094554 [Mycena olivaceomarginata]|nr:hypothetical protein B0H14DRAFT_3094554 [Mycena olivaceomarginata]
MLSATHNTQFTQTLMLFSQTQSGTRYTPHLTRFYASLLPPSILPLIHAGLTSLGVTCKETPLPAPSSPSSPSTPLRLRIGGHDARKEVFRGWLEVEPFEYHGDHGSFCGNPISWRQLWRTLIQSPGVEPYVLRKRGA